MYVKSWQIFYTLSLEKKKNHIKETTALIGKMKTNKK